MNLATNNINLTDVAGRPKKNTNLIRRYIIVGERRLSNYWWASVIFLGACGFLYTGISAYLGQSLFSFVLSSISGSANAEGNPQTIANDWFLPLVKTKFDISFFPQGLLMSFYGSLGLLLSLYWVLLIFWNVGGGFNEFNKKDGFIRIFRWGYPGKNRKIDLVYSLKDVEAIRVELKQGLDPQRTIFLRLKGNSSLKNNFDIANNTKPLQGIKREIPLTGISQPLTLKEIEKQASELANFLQVSLEGL